NALLKTLEEPPAHAVFILCTTESHKLPKTIISRCFEIDFTKATDGQISRSLKRIVKAENIKIQDDVLLEISRLSDGSFRDSSKILEELVLTAGRKTITKDLLADKYKTTGIETAIEEWINALKQKDIKKGFETVEKLSLQGMDFKFFIENLIDKFHSMLLGKVGVGEKVQDFSLDQIRQILEDLSKAYQETKYAIIPSLPLELLVAKWSKISPGFWEVEEEKTEITTPTSNTTKAKSKLSSFSQNFINEVKDHNHLIAGVLRSCEIENGKESLEIFAISKFHKEKLEEQKSIDILKTVANKLLQKPMKIHITLRG
ncbi:MAG: hypothetical protein HYT06_01320, partial [Candidatus Levybacteria bacterium]|nr:hypothetical protein [Candidatus Levybacteria bacterium]